MNRRALLLSLLLLVVLACGRGASPSPSAFLASATPLLAKATAYPIPTVPPEYQDIYNSLSASLDSFEEVLVANWDGTPATTHFGAELIVANGNRGEQLLAPGTMNGVRLYLDRLQELAVDGVTVQVSDPLLHPAYPRQSEYLAFYRQVAEEVRSRGLRLLVESGPVFAGTQFSRIRYDWSTYTREAYFQSRRDQLVLIAREIRPDYLSIGNEPSTETMLTGITFTLQDYLEYVRRTTAAIGTESDVLISCGTGSWEDPAYLQALIREPSLDLIDIHIYPLTDGRTDYLRRAFDAALDAAANGKRVIIGEAWLYKASPEEVRGLLSYADVYARDAYSFWQPLDIRFVEAIVGLAHARDIEYVSFFWSGFFFGYLDYGASTSNLSASDLSSRLNQTQYDNLLSGVITATGSAYQSLLLP